MHLQQRCRCKQRHSGVLCVRMQTAKLEKFKEKVNLLNFPTSCCSRYFVRKETKAAMFDTREESSKMKHKYINTECHMLLGSKHLNRGWAWGGLKRGGTGAWKFPRMLQHAVTPSKLSQYIPNGSTVSLSNNSSRPPPSSLSLQPKSPLTLSQIVVVHLPTCRVPFVMRSSGCKMGAL